MLKLELGPKSGELPQSQEEDSALVRNIDFVSLE